MEKSNNPNASKHMIELMSAALPYVGNRAKTSMELVIKTGELMDMMELNKPQDELSACDLQNEKVDMLALLEGIQPACSNNEKDLVNLVLNFSKAQNLYETYQVFREAQPTKDNTSNAKQNGFGFSNSSPMMDLLMSQLSPDQKSNFDNLSMMMQAMNL